MLQHTRLYGYRKALCRRNRNLITLTILLAGGILVSLPAGSWAENNQLIAADTGSDAAIQAQRKKANDWLDIAEAQLARQQYNLAEETVERCRELDTQLTDKQKKRLGSCAAEAQAGIDAQQKARQGLDSGSISLKAGNLPAAEASFKGAYALRKYLAEPTVKRIEDQLAAVESAQDAIKGEIKALFKKGVADYKAKKYGAAEASFKKVVDSGISLNFFDRGTMTTAEGFLEKIDAAKAKAMAQATAAAEKAVAEVKAEQGR